jgi:hypothetical protein
VLLRTTVVAAIGTTARSTVCFGTGFVDIQCSAVKVGAIQSRNCPVARGVVTHFHESKTSGLSRVTIGHDADPVDRAMCFKHRSNRILGSAEAQVSYKNIFHFTFFLKLQSKESRQVRTRAVGPDYRKMPKSTDCYLHSNNDTKWASGAIRIECFHASDQFAWEAHGAQLKNLRPSSIPDFDLQLRAVRDYLADPQCTHAASSAIARDRDLVPGFQRSGGPAFRS